MKTHTKTQYSRSAVSLVLITSLSVTMLVGCASNQQRAEKNPLDPLEPFNRSIYKFNDALDRAILKPVAKTYQKVMPKPAAKGVHNFFNNLRDVTSMANNILQLKPRDAANDLGRFFMNTTVGLLGFRDVASKAGFPNNKQTFGNTLGRWGIVPGPYVMLPILGPRTVRDTVAIVGDYYGDPVFYVKNNWVKWGATGVRVVDTRASFLGMEKMLDNSGLDRYSLIRDMYLQQRYRVTRGHENDTIGNLSGEDMWNDVDFNDGEGNQEESKKPQK